MRCICNHVVVDMGLDFTFFKKTTEPIELNFLMETSKDRGTKVDSNVSGHLTKMATTALYG